MALNGLTVYPAIDIKGGKAVRLLQGDFDKRKKKRIKGGSGCDDAGDILEHPECR